MGLLFDSTHTPKNPRKYIYLYIHICACISTCVSICIYTYNYICIYIYNMCMCVRACMRACVGGCMYVNKNKIKILTENQCHISLNPVLLISHSTRVRPCRGKEHTADGLFTHAEAPACYMRAGWAVAFPSGFWAHLWDFIHWPLLSFLVPPQLRGSPLQALILQGNYSRVLIKLNVC